MKAMTSHNRRSRFERDETRRPRRHAASVTYTLAALLALAVGTVAVYAQAGGGASALLSAGYDLAWNTVDGGGASASLSMGYSLSGTAGQPDAAVWSGGGYTLSGGFWHAAASAPGGATTVYLPLITK